MPEIVCDEDIGGIWLPCNETGFTYHTLRCNRPGRAHLPKECEYFDERSGMAVRQTGIAGKVKINERGHVIPK